MTTKQKNGYKELFSRAKATYADNGSDEVMTKPGGTLSSSNDSHTGRKLQRIARARKSGANEQSLYLKIFKQIGVLVLLAVLTLVVLYWQTIYRGVDYWWRHLRNPQMSGEDINALYPGSKAFYQLGDEHPTAAIVPPDDRLVIDKVEVNAPIVEVEDTDDDKVLEAIQHGVAHYPGTAAPGQAGNVFLTAHSSYWWWDPGEYKFVFQHLEDLVIGDTITVYYKQKRYDYRVREMKVIKPKGEDADHVFDQEPYQDDPILSLMTCVPVGTSLNRLIVIAEQVSPTPQADQGLTSLKNPLPVVN